MSQKDEHKGTDGEPGEKEKKEPTTFFELTEQLRPHLTKNWVVTVPRFDLALMAHVHAQGLQSYVSSLFQLTRGGVFICLKDRGNLDSDIWIELTNGLEKTTDMEDLEERTGYDVWYNHLNAAEVLQQIPALIKYFDALLIRQARRQSPAANPRPHQVL
jgi:hypothetical protein